MRRLRNLTRLAVVDIAPLRQVPGYRWLFVGMLFMQTGRQLTVVAVPFQVYQAIVQLTIRDAMRGQLSSMHIAVTAGGPRLGELEAGGIAALTSVRFSVISGGIACVLGTFAIARRSTRFLAYTYDPEPEAA